MKKVIIALLLGFILIAGCEKEDYILQEVVGKMATSRRLRCNDGWTLYSSDRRTKNSRVYKKTMNL